MDTIMIEALVGGALSSPDLVALAKTYYNPKSGYMGADKLYERVKHKGISRTDVGEWLGKQASAQITAPSKRKRANFYRITGTHLDWNADIVFYTKLERKNDMHVGYVLFVQIPSRYAVIYPIKTKDEATMVKIFKQFIHEHKPGTIASDNGSEFINKGVQALCEDSGVTQYFYEPGSHESLGIIDSLTKTLRAPVRRYMITKPTLRWIDSIHEVVDNYNNFIHSSLDGRTPLKASHDLPYMEAKHTADMAYNEQLRRDMGIYPGLTVRYALKRGILEKGASHWSATTHKVKAAEGLSYTLVGKPGRFRPWQLQRVDSVEGPPVDLSVEKALVAPTVAAPTYTDLMRAERALAKTEAELGKTPVLTTKRIRKPKVKN